MFLVDDLSAALTSPGLLLQERSSTVKRVRKPFLAAAIAVVVLIGSAAAAAVDKGNNDWPYSQSGEEQDWSALTYRDSGSGSCR